MTASFLSSLIAGKEAIFEVTVLGVKTKTLPPWDEALAAKIRDGMTLAELDQEVPLSPLPCPLPLLISDCSLDRFARRWRAKEARQRTSETTSWRMLCWRW